MYVLKDKRFNDSKIPAYPFINWKNLNHTVIEDRNYKFMKVFYTMKFTVHEKNYSYFYTPHPFELKYFMAKMKAL